MGSNYGTIGKETNYKDVDGTVLHIGDVVEFDFEKEDGNIVKIKAPIVNHFDKDFIMGVEILCNSEDGTFKGGIGTVKKIQDHCDLVNLEGITGDGYLAVEVLA